jgi:hypothetical protein
MKRPAYLLTFVAFIFLTLGWSIGSFFTQRSASKVLANLPASPIVLKAQYVKKKHAIDYSIFNPGGVPLTIIEESFVFTPGNHTTQKAYLVSDVPVKVVLPPQATTSVELKLKAGTKHLKLGDAVLATFTYIHPLSRDFYTVAHTFKMKKAKGGK